MFVIASSVTSVCVCVSVHGSNCDRVCDYVPCALVDLSLDGPSMHINKSHETGYDFAGFCSLRLLPLLFLSQLPGTAFHCRHRRSLCDRR